MIDSHCHLAHEKFSGDLDAVLERAKEAGISAMVSIGDTMEESKMNVILSEKYSEVFATVGVHPHHAKDWMEGDAQTLRDLSQKKKVVGIGEIGLDYHYMFSSKEVQQKVFRAQLTLAKELNLPAVIHTREAIEDTWEIVSSINPSKIVLHCCTERWDDVKRFVERGYFLSFTGIATYPKSEEIRETIRQCPLNQLMIETDAPFLAPIPHRGKRNEPAFVMNVAECVAEIKGISFEEVEKSTTENTTRFFDL